MSKKAFAFDTGERGRSSTGFIIQLFDVFFYGWDNPFPCQVPIFKLEIGIIPVHILVFIRFYYDSTE